MFSTTWQNYGFEIVVGLCAIALVTLTIYNLAFKSRGSFVDYTPMIKRFIGSMGRPRSKIPRQTQRVHRDVDTFDGNGGNDADDAHGTRRVGWESRGERACRRAAEELTGMPFNKARPNFLRNEITGRNLELDCYNPDLNIGIEYDGKQHYGQSSYFHTNREAFYNQKYRDDMKRRLCAQNGTELIVVSHTVKDVESYVKAELMKLLSRARI